MTVLQGIAGLFVAAVYLLFVLPAAQVIWWGVQLAEFLHRLAGRMLGD